MTLLEAYEKVNEHQPLVNPFVNICYCIRVYKPEYKKGDVLKLFDNKIKKHEDNKSLGERDLAKMRNQLKHMYD